ncbi:hypothetical protein [Maribacter halichondriae]|uniref:hypothetical protein n=1 Tax=Maribacter halichondriae TaxID=2980554 RepID=UPI00235815DA|nr:hypothetical protein [Maribacter sp. Hal144]
MGKSVYIISLLVMILLNLISCESTACCIQPQIELQGRFTHQILDCDNQENPEINCIEWLEFLNSSEVDILYGGGDIVYRFTYSQGQDFISMEGPPTSSFKPIFIIRDSATLVREDNGDIWRKE